MHYLPLSFPFFSILVGLFLLLVALIQVGILRYAYMRLGVSSGTALLLLLASLLGSYSAAPELTPDQAYGIAQMASDGPPAAGITHEDREERRIQRQVMHGGF